MHLASHESWGSFFPLLFVHMVKQGIKATSQRENRAITSSDTWFLKFLQYKTFSLHGLTKTHLGSY